MTCHTRMVMVTATLTATAMDTVTSTTPGLATSTTSDPACKLVLRGASVAGPLPAR
jgi:hypothetical protein